MIKFYVYPDLASRRKHRVEVRVFDTRKEMRKEISELEGGGYVDKDGMAWCVEVESLHESGRKGSTYAMMFFNRDDLNCALDHSLDTVSHECVHAAFMYAKRLKENVYQDEGEEVVCYAAGSLIGQVHAELTHRNVRH